MTRAASHGQSHSVPAGQCQPVIPQERRLHLAAFCALINETQCGQNAFSRAAATMLCEGLVNSGMATLTAEEVPRLKMLGVTGYAGSAGDKAIILINWRNAALSKLEGCATC